MKKIKKFLLVFVVLFIGTISLCTINGTFQIKKEEKTLVIVNGKNTLSSNYIPEDLTTPNIRFAKSSTDEEKLMSKEASESIEQLFKQAEAENIILYGNSGYRSYKTQKSTYDRRVKSQGKKMADKYVAKPGSSEHQTGLVMDVTNGNKNFIEGCKEAEWVKNNSHKYGFVVRYPKGKESITGYNYEPWHIRYVGNTVAKKIYEENLTLEEFLE